MTAVACCATAANGQVAANPAENPMNCRRCMPCAPETTIVAALAAP